MSKNMSRSQKNKIQKLLRLAQNESIRSLNNLDANKKEKMVSVMILFKTFELEIALNSDIII